LPPGFLSFKWNRGPEDPLFLLGMFVRWKGKLNGMPPTAMFKKLIMLEEFRRIEILCQMQNPSNGSLYCCPLVGIIPS
jgi:hypothetical protein